ncbi:hypothetical protein CBR_g34538 [Chara braunii]|uniref:protein-serine/threonine phosphatase n=1 Tax=Chara braunii TaxID=69332 RepID=A0A388LJ43_CHABU|nr:hypothetical protein CBR_g34538 [Chara braunii]|eukprot:GBG82255.1 hypothetical protein CBR_g34538 [Chara braunii]
MGCVHAKSNESQGPTHNEGAQNRSVPKGKGGSKVGVPHPAPVITLPDPKKPGYGGGTVGIPPSSEQASVDGDSRSDGGGGFTSPLSGSGRGVDGTTKKLHHPHQDLKNSSKLNTPQYSQGFSERSEDSSMKSSDLSSPNKGRQTSGLVTVSTSNKKVQTPNGSQWLKVLGSNYYLRYSFLSQRGYYPDSLDKENQDSFCVHVDFAGSQDDHFFGVFDGHGEYGAQCSQFARDKVPENLGKHRLLKTDVVQAYTSAFLTANQQMHKGQIDDSMSGTTGITCLVRGRMLYCANVGDSRAVLAERRGKKLVAVDLSSDQTPFRADECARVRAAGARVLTLDQLEGLKDPTVQCWGGEEDDDGDPPRLWVQNGMFPGTAFTRSLGDTVAEKIGVNAVPEVMVVELTDKHPFFVIASDGVFEFLSSQSVVDMVSKFEDPHDACAAIVAESYRLWLQYETRTDDITIIVVKIEGLKDVGSLPRSNGPAF